MKKVSTFLLVCMMVLCLSACGGNSTNTTISSEQVQNETNSEATENNTVTKSEDETTMDETKKLATDNAQMQTEDSSMPTRVIENGTRINMHFGDTVIPGILNDSETAQALIDMLPYTVPVNRYSHDYCGRMSEELPYKEEEEHYGWLNGDIDYATDSQWFTILFEGEEVSEQYGYQVNIGVMDAPLSTISELQGSYDVLIELAE